MIRHSCHVILFACLALALPAQAGGAKAVPDKEVAEKLKELKGVVSDRKFSRDAEGLDIITLLVKKWRGGLVASDQKAVVKGLGSVLLQGRVRPPDRIQLYDAAAAALGETGKLGAPPLQKAFESSRFPRKAQWIMLRESLLKALGKTKDEGMVKFLVDVAQRNPEPALQAAAGQALGNFDDSKESLRKMIVDKLLRTYGSMESKASVIDHADIQAQNARERLAVVSGKWNQTLRRLTGQKFDRFADWQRWFNKNKLKKWK